MLVQVRTQLGLRHCDNPEPWADTGTARTFELFGPEMASSARSVVLRTRLRGLWCCDQIVQASTSGRGETEASRGALQAAIATHDGNPLIDGRWGPRGASGRLTVEARAFKGAEPLCLEEEWFFNLIDNP